ncbi:hypothetical protein [Clostridium estertheticum]|uniref:Uncharacterized protein n=1 Tax=Clostridium estertheticum TaxID=238834 RepID=A0AA47I7F6_9CLOT|nr:hypothetical protein [Clostridium estertheticum]MBU3153488.1 hypothetical protein [Clostridium estertheticum]WAG60890.1 hypothetical protein LL038_01160 [Clostridium estertheticum]
MSESNSNSSTSGIGFCGLLTVLFVGLKLTNYIGWSWLWVLSPLWIPLAIVVGIFVLVFVGLSLFAGVKYFVDKYKED